jgi:hypothetical protein
LAKNNLLPRNHDKPAEYFMKLAALEQKVVRSVQRMKEQDRPISVVASNLVVAKALYSAGASSRECLTHVRNAADALQAKFKWSVQTPIKGIPNIGIYIEGMSSARLVDRHVEVVKAYRDAKFVVIDDWERSLLDSLASAFVPDSAYPSPKAAAATLPVDAPAEYRTRFVILTNAVRDGDAARFDAALDEYLVKEWGPVADPRARRDVDSKRVEYSGKWTFVGVAMCRAMFHLPKLSSKALEYTPVELFNPSESSVARDDGSSTAAPVRKTATARKKSTARARGPKKTTATKRSPRS